MMGEIAAKNIDNEHWFYVTRGLRHQRWGKGGRIAEKEKRKKNKAGGWAKAACRRNRSTKTIRWRLTTKLRSLFSF